MATVPISVGDLFQGGRVQAETSGAGPSWLTYRGMILAADELQFNFPSAASTGLTFGTPKSVYIDNSDNPFEMRMTVQSTNMTFPIPALSSGYYPLDSQGGSTIVLVADGNSTDVVTIIFYNYERTPTVWFKNGSSVAASVTVLNGQDVAQGDTTDIPVTNPALPGTLVGLSKGILTAVNIVATQIVTVVTRLTSILASTDEVVDNTGPYTYQNIQSATTSNFAGVNSVLGGVTINTPSAGTLTIYDNNVGSGNIIAAFDTSVAQSYSFAGGNGVRAGTGLTLVTTGTANLTISYRP